jgi:prepilin-type N-terminal cleavage/methylation domain-containing protein
MQCNLKSNPSKSSGFTLIEMMAVMLILAILTVFLLPKLRGASVATMVNATSTFIKQVDARAKEYDLEHGDYPPSKFPRELDPKPSATNMGAEMLVISLWSAKGAYQASDAEDNLGNSDGDNTGTSLTSFPSADVFELMDAWENPIAYIHSRDYDEVFKYRTYGGEGNVYDGDVRARMSTKTGSPMNRRTFQLISAGPDGQFGTGDDIGNFVMGDAAP